MARKITYPTVRAVPQFVERSAASAMAGTPASAQNVVHEGMTQPMPTVRRGTDTTGHETFELLAGEGYRLKR